MDDHPILLLLAEDNPGDARLVQEALREANAPFALERVTQLSEVVERVMAGQAEVVLLDLGLPDSQGLDTLLAVRAANPWLPVVVLTTFDEELGSLALRAGAQDYLTKGSFDAELLARSLRYAIERQMLLNQLEVRRRKEQEARELQLLEAVVGTSDTAVGTRLFGVRPLHDACGEIFTKLARRYGDILTQVVESGSGELDPSVLDQLDTMAAGLAVLHAGPRDAVEVHTAAIKVKERLTPAEEFSPYLERGRVVLFELISQLAAHYRTQAVWTRETVEA
jgi:CheY-like chemotaxis protein